MSLSVLSTFDGISCGQVALERAGIDTEVYYSSEIDKYAIQIAQKNYPETLQIGDITTIKGDFLSRYDLVMGGSPCQGFSFAGRQLNFDDPRSKLFFEFKRLLDECEPKYFLLENVNMKQESQDVISKALGVQPVKMNSSLVSAQLRNRLYWTNIPFTPPEDKGVLLKDIIQGGVVDRDKSYCIDANYAKGGNLKQYFEKSRRQLVFLEKIDRDKEDLEYRMLTPLECERLQTLPDNYTEGVSNTQRYKMIGNGWTVDMIAHILRGIK